MSRLHGIFLLDPALIKSCFQFYVCVLASPKSRPLGACAKVHPPQIEMQSKVRTFSNEIRATTKKNSHRRLSVLGPGIKGSCLAYITLVLKLESRAKSSSSAFEISITSVLAQYVA